MIERIGMTERWSDAVIVGDLILLVGHVAEQTHGQSVKVQTEEVLLSLDETLVQAGVSKKSLVSVTIYLSDMVRFAESA